MNLGNAPENAFMPDAENLVSLKAQRGDLDKGAFPVLIQ